MYREVFGLVVIGVILVGGYFFIRWLFAESEVDPDTLPSSLREPYGPKDVKYGPSQPPHP